MSHVPNVKGVSPLYNILKDLDAPKMMPTRSLLSAYKVLRPIR